VLLGSAPGSDAMGKAGARERAGGGDDGDEGFCAGGGIDLGLRSVVDGVLGERSILV